MIHVCCGNKDGLSIQFSTVSTSPRRTIIISPKNCPVKRFFIFDLDLLVEEG